MPIQWFPGHMAKATRVVQENLQLVDIVMEIVDARCPGASSNDTLLKVIGDKPRVVVLNKADLADPAITDAWIAHLQRQGAAAVALDAMRGSPREALRHVREAFLPKLEALTAKGRRPRPARAMVVGIPNVGKSSVINRLIGTKRAATGDKPGITKGKQWVRVGADVELLDIPGILQPKFEDQIAGAMLAVVGAIRDEVYDQVEIAGWLMPILHAKVPAGLMERLGVDAVSPDPGVNLESVARARGFLRQGGVPDIGKAAALVMREAREGRLGRLSLEQPPV